MKGARILKGLAAGLAGGLAGALVMGKAHGLISRLIADGIARPPAEDSTVLVARALTRPILGRELTAEEARKAGPMVHYAFGASMGAAYGALAEFVPSITAGNGALFGVIIWLGAHVIAVPALGLSAPVTQSPGFPVKCRNS